jgi:hypothetical protein
MPKAKKTVAAPSMTKSDFIRKFSFDTPAGEIVSKAKAFNLKLNPSFVHAIRAMDKKRNRAPGMAKAPAASGAPAGRAVNKSAFVRSLPVAMSASDVIAKGKAAGIKLTAAQVYTIRANAKRAGGKGSASKPTAAVAPKAAAPKAAAKASKAAKAPKVAAASGDHDQHFTRLVVNIGLNKAEALLERLREKLNSL